MLAYGKLSKQQMAHESGGDNIGFEFSGYIVSHLTSTPSSLTPEVTPEFAEDMTNRTHFERHWNMAQHGLHSSLPSGCNSQVCFRMCRVNQCALYSIPWIQNGLGWCRRGPRPG